MTLTPKCPKCWVPASDGLHSVCSVGVAARLSKAFGGSTESWLRQQMLYDFAQVEKKAGRIKVKQFEAV